MESKAQILLEVIVNLIVFVGISILIFALLTAISKATRYSEDSLVIYNRTNNYTFILLGKSRENFSSFDLLYQDIDYYLEPTSTGYLIKEGKEQFLYRGENYYVWFRIADKMFNGDFSQKLFYIFVQTPSTIKKTPVILTNLKEKTIFQDEWSEATSSIINIPFSTSIIYYATKSESIKTNGEIYLP